MIKISRAMPADTNDLLHILNDALAYKLSQGDEAWERVPWTIKEVNHSINSGNTFLVRIDDKTAASLILIWEDERTWGEKGLDGQAGYLHRMAVAEAFRGQQLGNKIVNWAADQAGEHHRHYLRLDCPADNHKLCAYYQSLGFNMLNNAGGVALFERKI